MLLSSQTIKWSIISSLTLSLVLTITKNASSQNTNECYFVRSNGKIASLPPYMCKSSVTNLSNTSSSLEKNRDSVNQNFLEDYTFLVMQEPDQDLRSFLLDGLKESPASLISDADRVCHALKTGLSMDEIQEAQASGITSQPGTFIYEVMIRETGWTNGLAVKHFCPEFASR